MDKSLQYNPESSWKQYDNPQDQEEISAVVGRYLDFLSTCKTEREVINYVEARLREAGYTDDLSQGLWVRPFREKALFAFKRGTEPLEKGLSLIAAHTDSPRLDLKQHPFLEQADVAQAETHYYGGIKKYQWLSRPLALHGVVLRENGERVDLKVGEKEDDPVFCIADLLPHLGHRELEKTVKEAFDGEKMKILLGHKVHKEEEEQDKSKELGPLKGYLLAILKERYGLVEEDFITAEIELVPAGRARYVGFDQGLVGAYGQDDRICVFTALEALLATHNQGRAKAIMFWDKEEIGSEGATGASSRFLEYCVEEVLRTLEPKTPLSQVFLNTEALSADVTGAIDPDFQDLHSKGNSARLGFGPCFCKFTGSRGKAGASEADAEYFVKLRKILNQEQVPWQVAELGKVDVGGGGTVALFMAALGMQVIDLGPALLAMHSPFEISSSADIYSTFRAYRSFLNR